MTCNVRVVLLSKAFREKVPLKNTDLYSSRRSPFIHTGCRGMPPPGSSSSSLVLILLTFVLRGSWRVATLVVRSMVCSSAAVVRGSVIVSCRMDLSRSWHGRVRLGCSKHCGTYIPHFKPTSAWTFGWRGRTTGPKGSVRSHRFRDARAVLQMCFRTVLKCFGLFGCCFQVGEMIVQVKSDSPVYLSSPLLLFLK